MRNEEFLAGLEEIRRNDQAAGTDLESVLFEILRAFTVYGKPGPAKDDIRTRGAHTMAAICELATARTYQGGILEKVYQDFLWTAATAGAESRKRADRNALSIEFMKRWAADLESTGQARNRREAIEMACRALYNLQRESAPEA